MFHSCIHCNFMYDCSECRILAFVKMAVQTNLIQCAGLVGREGNWNEEVGKSKWDIALFFK